jgi:putative transposase
LPRGRPLDAVRSPAPAYVIRVVTSHPLSDVRSRGRERRRFLEGRAPGLAAVASEGFRYPRSRSLKRTTYVRTWEGWLYLAVVVDLFSRRIVGWAIRDHLRTELVAEALVTAIGHRVPQPGLLHHSDQGSQYGSDDYRRLLTAHGIACSMSRRGNCWDNAVVESFFATLKRELLYRRSWPTRDEAKACIDEWIDFYNRERRHSYLAFRSPEDYEKLFALRTAPAA